MDDFNFFKALNSAELSHLDRTKGTFPWEMRTMGEDRAAAEDQIADNYQRLNLKRPKFAWATSPAALWSARTMMRQYPMKQTFIDAIIPNRGLVTIESEARRAMLEAILDNDLLVSTGAPVAPMLCWRPLLSPPRAYHAINDADRIITHNARASDALSQFSTPAGWSNAVLYPALHPQGIGHLAANAFCILPYVKLCWLCLPPLFMKTEPTGHLHCDDGPAARWSDGYEIRAKWEPEKQLEAGDEEEPLALPGKPNPENKTLSIINAAVDSIKRKNIDGK
jgi:hypothetical protein